MKTPLGNTKPRSGLVAALDMGSSKISCLIARLATGVSGQVTARVVGIGHQKSHGLKSGSVIDLDAAEATIRATVEAAETMVGENIRKVFVNLSCGRPKSRLVAHETTIGGREIEETDLYRVLASDQVTAGTPADRELIHSIPVGYSVDDNRGVRDPRGMYGARLGANVHLVTAQSGPVKNLRTVVDRCHLEIEGLVATPYASALACLVEDERQLGTTCIDIGGGVTSLAIFCDGELVHTDVIPLGGGHMTNDIARGLSTPLESAERMKALFGCVIPSPSDDAEMITVPLIGEDREAAQTQVPRSVLVGIVRPRAEEMMELVRDRLAASGFDKAIGQRVVLTGGASQLSGLAELAGDVLGRQVRLARPRGVEGLSEAVSGPGFATSVGLIRYAVENPLEVAGGDFQPIKERSGAFGRFGQWLRENF
ncbi:MAG: cell division protein FtsA [Rhodospirillales bacterium CG15_BIG_FIL_POST_REV_8_21_14_020_66_15]|nr:MAG: cell division protein FtsA [Rhodospirillales bacterium CG15_BIG_FIL_POST_REV_8_21_14_020_66_15]